MNFMDKYRQTMRSFSTKTKKNIKLGLDVLIILTIVLAVKNGYDNGVHNGRAQMCEDNGLILVQQQGKYSCESLESYIARKESVAVGLISEKNMEAYLNQNDIQSNFT